jgi:PAS domain S-box-containing protein
MKKRTNHDESAGSMQASKFTTRLFGSEINEQVMILISKDFIIQDINIQAAENFFRKGSRAYINRSLCDILIENGFSVKQFKDALNNNKTSSNFIQLEKLISDKKEYFASFISVVIDKKVHYVVSIMVNNSQGIFDSYMNVIINNLPGSVYWKDLDGHYLGCNKFVATMAGYDSPAHIIGKTDYDLCWKEFADEWRLLDKKVMTENETIIREELAKLADGRVITELTHKSPLKNEENKIIGIIGTSLDITDRKQMEQELIKAKEDAERAIADKIHAESATLLAKIKAENEEEMRKTVMVLVGDIVHDLRTPIATIRTARSLLASVLPGLIEAVEEGKALGAQKIHLLNQKKLAVILDNTLLDSVQNAVLMMDDFINTTLAELSNAQKAQQGELTNADLTKCSSRRILENTLDAYPTGGNFKIHQQITYDFYLMGNSILIMRILFNLIKNAVEQIILNGRGEISIVTEDAGDVNVIKVKDTAGGAPPEVVSHLFTGYFTTKKNGTGIGLAFAKRTMKNFGGDLTYHNVYGDYIEFILSFPKVDDR